MGAARVNAGQLVLWFNGRHPRPSGSYSASVDVAALAHYYMEEGGIHLAVPVNCWFGWRGIFLRGQSRRAAPDTRKNTQDEPGNTSAKDGMRSSTVHGFGHHRPTCRQYVS